MKELKLSNNHTFYFVEKYKGKQMRKLYAFRTKAQQEGFDMYEHFDEALAMILEEAKDQDGNVFVVTMSYLDELEPEDIQKLNGEVNSFLVAMNKVLLESVLNNTTDGNTASLKEKK